MKSQQHRIPPLEGGFKDLDSKIEPLKGWLKAEEASWKVLLRFVDRPATPWQTFVSIAIAAVWPMVVIIAIYCFRSFVVMEATVPLMIVLVMSLFLGLISMFSWLSRQKDKTKQKVLAERKADPLYQRCQLILRAVESYKVHCERYETWQQAANLDLLDRDNELAVRYQNFIMQAHENLERAISDFLRNAELARVQKEFLEKHQLPSGPDDAALSQLMAQVNQPMEIPDATNVSELRIRLECEQELQEIFDDPLNERELASRMDNISPGGRNGH